MYHLKPSASLSKGLLMWLLGVGVVAAAWAVTAAFMTVADAYVIAALFYVAVGVWLTRRLTRDLVNWIPYHGTVANISGFKTGMTLLWVWRWPLEILRMGISRL